MNPSVNNTSPTSSASVTTANAALTLQTQDHPRILQSPDEVIEFCFTDPAGHSLTQAPVHRALQAFLGRHRRALIELPRDHGKSGQGCLRILWELGRGSSLPLRSVCGA